MLAGAIDVVKGLLVLQAGKTVVGGQELELLHGQEVVIDGQGALLKDGGKLVLGGGDLVVLGLCGDAQLPQLVVDLLHEGVDGGTDGAEVVLLELLALCGRAAKEGAAGEDEVGTCLVVLLLDQEVLLLGATRGDDAPGLLAKELEHALCLLLKGDLGAQERGLLVQGLAGVGDECRGDAEDLVLDEGGAHGVPDGVAACLEGGAQAAGGEGGGVGLALDELLAREGHQHGAVVLGVDEGVMLLGGDAGEGLEPVGEVGGAVLQGPLLHRVSHGVGDAQVYGLAVVDGLTQLLVYGLGQAFLHVCVGEDQAPVLGADLVCCHASFLSVYAAQHAFAGRAQGPLRTFGDCRAWGSD